jgi:uncharacterized protein (TIGR02145 family)
MSGIFKGDSIYKSGGGGGGYSDGGQLVDGDFIEVKNNTVSTYDNTARDPINFYFEVKEGEILNSVIELTTVINSTVYVYVVKGGFYFLLGNAGGNTVTADEDYKINITGDSYSIEQVSGGDMQEPRIPIGRNTYGVAKITGAGLYIMTENLNENLEDASRQCAYNNDNTNRENGYGLLYDPLGIWNSGGTLKESFAALIPPGWRIPSTADYKKITDIINNVNEIKSKTGWNGTNGNNTLGTNFLPSGEAAGNPANTWNYKGNCCYLWTSSVSGNRRYYFDCSINNYNLTRYMSYWNDDGALRYYYPIRFVKDI